MAAVLAGPVPADEDSSGPVELQSARVVASDDRYLLDAFFELEPTEAVHGALTSGVPLTMKLEVEVFTPRRWWWDRRLASVERRYVLRHHALTEQFILRNLNSGRQQSYDTLPQALEALGTIARLPILDADALPAESGSYARLRVQLDVEALPVPLRPQAYLQSSWAFSSDWHKVVLPAS